MERLTTPGYKYRSCDFMDDGVYIDMNRLREYEDTGLTPEQIQELRKQNMAAGPKSSEEKSMDKISITLTLYFEIKDADLFGGDGTVGYTKIHSDLRISHLEHFNAAEYAKALAEDTAKLLHTSPENMKIISRMEYEENTEE